MLFAIVAMLMVLALGGAGLVYEAARGSSSKSAWRR